MQPIELLCPVWPAPANVVAGVTTRIGGASLEPYDSFNLALHVNDQPETVCKNRQQLAAFCIEELSHQHNSDQRWHWLDQTHSNKVKVLGSKASEQARPWVADASITTIPGNICVVLTADCLPLLLCDVTGSCVAAAHVGWRGLAGGIIDNTLAAMQDNLANKQYSSLYAWLGPAIGPNKFIVGEDVRSRMLDYFSRAKPGHNETGEAVNKAFRAIDQDEGFPTDASNAEDTGIEIAQGEKRYFADLYHLASMALHRNGVQHIFGGGFCTASDKARFFSYRRDRNTGRMASFIFIDG